MRFILSEFLSFDVSKTFIIWYDTIPFPHLPKVMY